MSTVSIYPKRKPLLHAKLLSQVDLAGDLALQELDLRPRHHDLPQVDDVGTMGDLQGIPDVVIGNEYSDSPVGQIQGDALDLVDGDRIDAGKWFIQKEKMVQPEPRDLFKFSIV